MARYFDPQSCPVCGADLPSAVTRCPGCRLRLTHPTVGRLATLLSEADRTKDALVADPTAFRADPTALHPDPTASQGADHRLGPGPEPVAGTAPAAAPTADPVRHSAVRSTLLLVGALCLLGAGSVFALVTWMLLPWQARLVVMLGLAGGALAVAPILRRRGLPGSAETAGALATGFHLIGLAVAAPHAEEPRVVHALGLAVLCAVGWGSLHRGLRRGVLWRSADAAGAVGLGGLGLLLVEQAHRHGPWVAVVLVLGIPALADLLARRPRVTRAAPVSVWSAALVLGVMTVVLVEQAVLAARAEHALGTGLLAGWPLPWLATVLVTASRAAVPLAWSRVALALDAAAGALVALWWLVAADDLAVADGAWSSVVLVAVVGLVGAVAVRATGDVRPLVALAPGLLLTASGVVPGLALGAWQAAHPVRQPSSLVWTWPVSALVLTVLLHATGRRPAGRQELRRILGIQGETAVLATLVVPWCAWNGAGGSSVPMVALSAGWLPAVGAAVAAAVIVVGGAIDGRRRRPDPSASVWWGAALLLTHGHTERLVAVLLVGAAGCAGWSLLRRRRALGMVATGLLLVACWLLLAMADVTVPEAYTLTAAACLAAWTLPATLTLRTPSYAAVPALAVALAPTTMMGVDDTTSVRALVGIVAAVALTALGAGRRRAAHLYVGAAAAGALALALCAPVVSLLPPWLPLAVGGGVLVGLGVTWEARLAELRRVRSYAAALR
ncbi:hypothetical protein GGG17_00840 [Arsenicicoccus sp. MKL-02]|uniref:DUF2157 domain-containing protein n=1 Tax=Arsenicicoccus cauae TaxID=2663847 RepID=A0A6I3I310_9MICO|nr:hypothetical protein [Arsenicicoccus cauae]MTB70544.1 hypothetical protein [Arsenicicoccus cauae]